MIITFDGPAASGKSTIARLIAEQLNYTYLNSGLLFRALAYVFLNDKHYSESHLGSLKPYEVEEIINLGRILYEYSFEQGPTILLDNNNITPYLKEPRIDCGASIISTNPIVRQVLLDYQRFYAQNKNIIVDGRDAGTVVFPHAHYKFYLIASVQVRASRWQKEQAFRNNSISLEQALEFIKERDTRDSTREHAPLKPASDAFIIDTSNITIQDCITQIIDIVHA